MAERQRNLLLDRLDAPRRDALEAKLTTVALQPRQAIYEPYDPITHVYFPIDVVFSYVSLMEQGHSSEVATVGCEGALGATLLLDGQHMPFRSEAQIPGSALVMKAADFLGFLAEDAEFRIFVQRYLMSFIVELGQGVACSSLHRADRRLARWLLIGHDRAQRDRFEMTQDTMAEMLGVRRATVTEAAGELRRAGAVDYASGRVVVVDRARLEALSCECYGIIRDVYDRLLANAN